MLPLSANELANAVLAAFEESNSSGIAISPSIRNPRKFVVQVEDGSLEVWTYIWNLTHGGGAARPANEYRIQITGVDPPLETNPNGPTVLLGFEPNLGCFAGFDISRHLTFSRRSPSIQIPITALHEALQSGLAFAVKGNNEIAIGIRPDFFLQYVQYAIDLHRYGIPDLDLGLLSRAAASQEITPQELEPLPEERSKIARLVSQFSRDHSFRKRVREAYGHRCAVTRNQMGLIDAAHILPVGVSGSTDQTSNGICLSPTYHRAFDKCLIYLDEDFIIRINQEKVRALDQANQVGGLENFSQVLNVRIHLPEEITLRPDIAMIRAANELRGVR